VASAIRALPATLLTAPFIPCKVAGLYLLHTQRQAALLTTAASRHCIMLRASQHLSSSLVPVALAVVFLAVSTTSAAPAAPVAVPPVLAPGTETNVTTAPAQAPAQAPTAAVEAPAGTPTNPFGDTGFITVQGNKFVDANCKV